MALIDKESREMIVSQFEYENALNLGCGNDYVDGWTNLDKFDTIKADVHCNIDNNALPFEDETFDLIWASHVLEHIVELAQLKQELHRIMKPQSPLVILVPYYLSLDAWGDDTHVRGFSEHSFFYQYWPGFGDINLMQIPSKDHEGRELTWLLAKVIKKPS